MTTRLVDARRVTTPSRLRLPAEIVAALTDRAVTEGIPVEELAARLLVDVLPELVAERTDRWLRTTLSLAYPVDVPAAPGSSPDDISVALIAPARERLAHLSRDAHPPGALTPGGASELCLIAETIVPGPGTEPEPGGRGATS